MLTHVIYGPASVNKDGGIQLPTTFGDPTIQYPDDPPHDTEQNVWGPARQLFILKKNHRGLKTLLSVNNGIPGIRFATNETIRNKFVQDATQLIQNYGFDGIDLVWKVRQKLSNNFVLADS